MPAAPNAQQIANSLTPDNLMDQLSTMQAAINAQYIPTQPPPSLLNQPLPQPLAPLPIGRVPERTTFNAYASPYGAWSSDIARMSAGMQPGSVSVSRNRPSAGFSNMVSGKDKYGHDVQSYTDRSGTQHNTTQIGRDSFYSRSGSGSRNDSGGRSGSSSNGSRGSSGGGASTGRSGSSSSARYA